MKFYFKPVLSVIILAILLGYTGCGPKKDPGPTEEEQALTNLSGTWKLGDDVKLEGISQKANYTNFTLTLSGTPGAGTYQYTVAGRPDLSPWPANGTWKFGTTIATDIVRDPGAGDNELQMNYTVSGNNLELTFTYDKAGVAGSRTQKVDGTWIMELTK